MSKEDFQGKFLKIGYSKRKEGSFSPGGRPFIGRKGIGKLALLSCADKISVISKVKGGDYVGGTIDNSGLDEAIKDDLTPDKYPLEEPNLSIFEKYTEGHKKGTIIHFENIKEGIKNSLDYLKKMVALYFKFSLKDKSFNIFIDDEKITYKHLRDLAEKTQFLWKINNLKDPYVDKELKNLKDKRKLRMEGAVKGFIASVEKPVHLKILTTDESVSVDLFVNGRLRERDILEHIPTARLVENYLYGQIHFDELDDTEDRFTSSRESIVADDAKYKRFLEKLRSEVIGPILEDWDEWRWKHKQDGDPDNPRMTKKERKSRELYNAVSAEYSLSKKSRNRGKVEGWVDSLAKDATHNFIAYADCFISENLVRNYIKEKKIKLSTDAEGIYRQWKDKEKKDKITANINIELRKNKEKIGFLDMTVLAKLADRQRGSQNCLATDAKEYGPIRNALMHTALLTDAAKLKLRTVYENMKGRVKRLLT